ncbi:cysteine-rich CWC family protein [Shewanella electrodiphila]|uniref:Cysteine-rich CWC family protein n=1 Tax=Shewanella electrodiphila TaxID=934143 RepID=A0ABT0KSZ0_9GAMM|nr:cysteine-rich CWC family protein [Shewanella electrodiphila]MCL1046724.1 cysteine-rich CWC family protein [Shewanella electrodiphila]
MDKPPKKVNQVQQYRPDHVAKGVKSVSEPLVCPVCLKENHCAVSAGLAIDQCWCLVQSAEKKIDSTVLSTLSGKACVCQACYIKLTQ